MGKGKSVIQIRINIILWWIVMRDHRQVNLHHTRDLSKTMAYKPVWTSSPPTYPPYPNLSLKFELRKKKDFLYFLSCNAYFLACLYTYIAILSYQGNDWDKCSAKSHIQTIEFSRYLNISYAMIQCLFAWCDRVSYSLTRMSIWLWYSELQIHSSFQGVLS